MRHNTSAATTDENNSDVEVMEVSSEENHPRATRASTATGLNRNVPPKKRKIIGNEQEKEQKGGGSTSPAKSMRQDVSPENSMQRQDRPQQRDPGPSPFKILPNGLVTFVYNKPDEAEVVVAREKQFKLLKAALGHSPEQALPRAVFLWGASSSGKSYTLQKALEGTGIHQIKIHSSEILCGRRAFFETIVKQLVSSSGKELGPKFKCDTLRSLYSNFCLYFELENKKNQHLQVIIIVEGAESLRGENEDILQFLVSLQDITQADICVVLMSNLPFIRFTPSLTEHAILPIYFPQYTQEELTQILIKQKLRLSSVLSSKGDNSYDFYVKMIVQMFFFVCRDLRKLQRLTQTHWKEFQELVNKSTDYNLTKLWKSLEPQLKDQFFEMNTSVTTVQPGGSDKNSQQFSNKGLEMPLNAKLLLIASYLATHNPPSSDKRFFVKGKTGKGKKSRANNAGMKTDITVVAKSFELNRLQAIFSSIQSYCDEQAVNKNRNISFMTLLSTLCQNKLVQHLGEDSSGNQKYKCLLDYDTLQDISRSVNFELNNYLYRLI